MGELIHSSIHTPGWARSYPGEYIYSACTNPPSQFTRWRVQEHIETRFVSNEGFKALRRSSHNVYNLNCMDSRAVF